MSYDIQDDLRIIDTSLKMLYPWEAEGDVSEPGAPFETSPAT
jgi:hypothetical protein